MAFMVPCWQLEFMASVVCPTPKLSTAHYAKRGTPVGLLFSYLMEGKVC